MKIFLKILLGLVFIIFVFAAYIQFVPPNEYDFPIVEFELSIDSSVLARGEYLVYGPARCAECHTQSDYTGNLDRVPLAGGNNFHLPFATMFAPNLTPDPDTGIGNVSNGEIARTVRHSINRHNHVIMPFMNLTHLSDCDMLAIVSFLKSQTPIRNKIPTTEYNFLGKLIRKLMLKPSFPTQSIPENVEQALSLEYGGYLVNEVANCDQCHTPFDMSKMEFSKEKHLAGGQPQKGEEWEIIPPNLTPDPKTGHIVNWSEEQFLIRFRSGKVFPESIMPWDLFAEMKDDDLRSMYRYLQSIEPIENDPGPIARKKDATTD